MKSNLAEPPGPLNIGAFSSVYSMGGAQNSTVTLCNELARRGHRVTLYCPASHMFSHLCPAFEVVELPLNLASPSDFHNITFRNIRLAAREVRCRRHDVLLCFTYHPILMTLPLVLTRGLPCVVYFLGFERRGLMKAHLGTVVANSEETRAVLAGYLRRDPQTIPVVRGRVDVSLLESGRGGDAPNPYLPPSGMRQLGMMSTWHAGKMSAIEHALKAAELLGRRRSDFRLVLAGEGRMRPKVEELLRDANAAVGREVALTVGYVGDVARFLEAADVVLGIGRCAFEAMALSKPTLIVGRYGFAGTVEPGQVDRLAHFNFAGRNVSEDQPVEHLADQLDRLLSSASLRRDLGTFAREYMMENLTAASGAARLEKVLREQHAGRPSGWRAVLGWTRFALHGAMWMSLGVAKWMIRPERAAAERAKIERVRRSGAQYCLNAGFARGADPGAIRGLASVGERSA